ncbi:MerR family transcriptional regulator [Pseudoalteromonas rubra]|uniref:MerR family transcriptional regulator n=1 Tax=Pseudoalteromonas rubra TaxID=43658 RepID=UPI002DBFA038|nr:MerR family transcriptional regulator [Pseudoalteromonas rubra]MEC4090892.1 MerR family transcriptional regulator [Pseudoalteromonas rubra]
MYRISELAAQLGLARSTLLYYEKRGLICGRRASNGYRVYGELDLQKLRLLQQLQAGGLTLSECKQALEARLDRTVLSNRLAELETEIAHKQQAHTLLSALLGRGSLRDWHVQADKLAPDAHRNWLEQQGFDEQQTLYLKWLSKDMNEHDTYMADFMAVFHRLERWGPGSNTDTRKALTHIPFAPHTVLDIGCGKGFATELLAQQTQAQITAVDNEAQAIDSLAARLKHAELDERVTPLCASMTALPFQSGSFDLLWAESSAYIMGFEAALNAWRPLLRSTGCLMVSDLVWLNETPSQEAITFWQQEYPDMQTVAVRLAQIEQAGFRVLSHFTLSEQAWADYYRPLKAEVEQRLSHQPDSAALQDMAREIAIYERYLGEFGYQMFVLQRSD